MQMQAQSIFATVIGKSTHKEMDKKNMDVTQAFVALTFICFNA